MCSKIVCIVYYTVLLWFFLLNLLLWSLESITLKSFKSTVLWLQYNACPSKYDCLLYHINHDIFQLFSLQLLLNNPVYKLVLDIYCNKQDHVCVIFSFTFTDDVLIARKALLEEYLPGKSSPYFCVFQDWKFENY